MLPNTIIIRLHQLQAYTKRHSRYLKNITQQYAKLGLHTAYFWTYTLLRQFCEHGGIKWVGSKVSNQSSFI